MSGNPTIRREEIDQLFRHALPLIDRALSHEYGLAQEEAADVEQSLHVWFHAFVRRPGTPRSEGALRPHLIMMACQAAHVYWSGKLEGSAPSNEKVRRSLELGPAQIAIEIEKENSNKTVENGTGDPDGEERP